jgi:hypothetical protein
MQPARRPHRSKPSKFEQLNFRHVQLRTHCTSVLFATARLLSFACRLLACAAPPQVAGTARAAPAAGCRQRRAPVNSIEIFVRWRCVRPWLARPPTLCIWSSACTCDAQKGELAPRALLAPCEASKSRSAPCSSPPFPSQSLCLAWTFASRKCGLASARGDVCVRLALMRPSSVAESLTSKKSQCQPQLPHVDHRDSERAHWHSLPIKINRDAVSSISLISTARPGCARGMRGMRSAPAPWSTVNMGSDRSLHPPLLQILLQILLDTQPSLNQPADCGALLWTSRGRSTRRHQAAW